MKLQIGLSFHLLWIIPIVICAKLDQANTTKTCTYSFTVPTDNVEETGAFCPKSQSSEATAMDSQVARRLLLTVNKLLQYQASALDITEAHKAVKRLSRELEDETNHRKELEKRLTSVQNDLHLLTSGQTTYPDTEYHPFTGFTGNVLRFWGCPYQHPDRIHTLAPLKATLNRVIRIVPRSCHEWQESGYSFPGFFLIDPDGLEGEPAFKVECVEENGKVMAVIHHDQENRTHVQGHEDPGSFSVFVSYRDISPIQLEALIASSSQCEQYLRWECHGATITKQTWWADRNGKRMRYWAGGEERGKGCACNVDRTCVGNNLCNCDENDDTRWLEDSGFLRKKDTLPITRLYIGDTGSSLEQAYYTIGPLRCVSDAINPYRATNAFLPADTWPPFPVFCDYTGWIVIQRFSLNNITDFNRDWNDYSKGFGDLNGDFWLGLDKLHQLTVQKDISYTLQIALMGNNGINIYVQYRNFKVGNATTKYQLSLGEFEGEIIDLLRVSDGALFTTQDQDNDHWPGGNCAVEGQQFPSGGWWYAGCGKVYLNSPRLAWGTELPLQAVHMRIKPDRQ